MSDSGVVEVSLVDIAQAFRRRWKLFFSVGLVCLLCVVAVLCQQRSVLMLNQRVQVASFLSPYSSSVKPLVNQSDLFYVVLPRLVAQQSAQSPATKWVTGLQASPVVVKNPIALYDKPGAMVKQYVPATVFNLTLFLTNKSEAAKGEAGVAFDKLLKSLQTYQMSFVTAQRNQWKQTILSSQQQLAGLLHMNQKLQADWGQNAILKKGRLHASTASTFATAPGLSSMDVAEMQEADRVSSFGMQYQTKIAALRSKIYSAQLGLKTIQSAHLVGAPYFVVSSNKYSLLLVLACFLSLIVACLAVALAELFKRRD